MKKVILIKNSKGKHSFLFITEMALSGKFFNHTSLHTYRVLNIWLSALHIWHFKRVLSFWAENSLKSCSEVAVAGTGAVTQFPSMMSPDGCKTSLSHSSGMSPWSGEEIWTMASLFCNCKSGAQQWTQSVGMAKLEHKNISSNWAFSIQLDHLPEN